MNGEGTSSSSNFGSINKVETRGTDERLLTRTVVAGLLCHSDNLVIAEI